MKEVFYKNSWLQRGSYAYELFFDKDPDSRKKLDKHMKELDQKDKDLRNRYEKVSN